VKSTEFNSRMWIYSVPRSLVVQLHSKLLVTVRDISAGCNWSTRTYHCTRQLLLHT